MEDPIIQLGNIKQKHTQIFEKLKKIQLKIEIMLSKQGGKNKEIQELIRSIEKIIKTSGLSDETFETINKSFEDAKKIENDEDKISSLEEVKKKYIELIDTINKEKIVKIKSEIDSIINSIQKIRHFNKYLFNQVKSEIMLIITINLI